MRRARLSLSLSRSPNVSTLSLFFARLPCRLRSERIYIYIGSCGGGGSVGNSAHATPRLRMRSRVCGSAARAKLMAARARAAPRSSLSLCVAVGRSPAAHQLCGGGTLASAAGPRLSFQVGARRCEFFIVGVPPGTRPSLAAVPVEPLLPSQTLVLRDTTRRGGEG